MKPSIWRRTLALSGLLAVAGTVAFSSTAVADHVATFATGGYANAVRSDALFKKMDTNRDGMISRDEWLAFHEKLFAMLDTKKTGVVSAKAFTHETGDVASFATGGYSRGLRSMAMMHKIDTDGDGTVSHEEFIAYESKVFDMLDVNSAHKGMIGKPEIMVATGGFAAAP